jgi:hypothetical protein
LSGPIYQNNGAVILNGTGAPGEAIYIDINGVFSGLSGIVGADGTFVISGTPVLPITTGSGLTASAGSPTGPSSAGVTAVSAPLGASATAMTALGGGASVITANGIPGTVITVVNPATGDALGSATVASNGEVAVMLSSPLPPSTSVDLVSGGILQSTISSAASAGAPPGIGQGSVLTGGSVIQGTGVPGATIQAVDTSGKVLGTTVVNSQGGFSLSVSGASAGEAVDIIQNGVKASTVLTALSMGAEHAFTSVNVFNPAQGASLQVSFKTDVDDHVTVRIFNVAASLVRPLVEMDTHAGVVYAADWNGRNGDGSMVASGLYIISVQGSSVHTLKKVVVLK